MANQIETMIAEARERLALQECFTSPATKFLEAYKAYASTTAHPVRMLLVLSIIERTSQETDAGRANAATYPTVRRP